MRWEFYQSIHSEESPDEIITATKYKITEKDSVRKQYINNSSQCEYIIIPPIHQWHPRIERVIAQSKPKSNIESMTDRNNRWWLRVMMMDNNIAGGWDNDDRFRFDTLIYSIIIIFRHPLSSRPSFNIYIYYLLIAIPYSIEIK